jgi:FKBP-type peptidyl-prolyl cis-trans isomerase
MKFTLADDQGRVVAEALAEAKKLTENGNDALALEMICQDWLADKGKVPEVTSLKDMVKYIENVYSVKITAKVDAKAKKAKEAELKAVEAEVEKEKAEAKAKKAAASKKKGGKKKASEEVNVDDLLGGDELLPPRKRAGKRRPVRR